MSVHLKSIKGDKVQRRRYAVNAGRTKLLIKEYITWYNEQQEDNKKRIKNARHLALCLVDLYAKQFVRWQAIMGYDVEITNENLPHVSVNNEFLGDELGKSGRTIRNYRKKLAQAGILMPVSEDEGNKAFRVGHGWQSNYELALNPRLLWIVSNLHTARVEVQGVPDYFAPMQIFPPTGTCTLTRTLTRTVSGKKHGPPVDNLQEPGNRDGQSRQMPVQDETRTDEKAAGGAEKLTEEGRGAAEAAESSRKKAVRGFSKALFNRSKTWLYPGEPFKAADKERIIQKIEVLFGRAPEEKLLKIYTTYIQRLKLAQLYWHSEVGALPEAEVFFDPSASVENFTKTREWWCNEEKYPLPERQTYRIQAAARLSGRGRFKGTNQLGDVLNY